MTEMVRGQSLACFLGRFGVLDDTNILFGLVGSVIVTWLKHSSIVGDGALRAVSRT